MLPKLHLITVVLKGILTTELGPRSGAAEGQNRSLFDKSMKLCRNTNIPRMNILGYGTKRNSSQELCTAHVLKWRTCKRG